MRRTGARVSARSASTSRRRAAPCEPPIVYPIHFAWPLGEPDPAATRSCASHYLGTTYDLRARLCQHGAGQGAPIMRVVRDQGIPWFVARTWVAGRALERALKRRHNNPSFVPGLPDCSPGALRGLGRRRGPWRPRPRSPSNGRWKIGMTAGKWRREPDPSRRHRLLADVDWTRRYTAAVIADARQAGAEVPSRSRPRSRSGGDEASGWRPGPRERGSDHGTRARDQREPLAGRGDLLGLPPSEPRAHHRELPRARTGRWPWRSSRWRRRRPRRPSRWVLSGPGSGSRARSCARPLGHLHPRVSVRARSEGGTDVDPPLAPT
jgi:hypothetical protein